MSTPRRPFGTQQPGRLQATMLRVLAAEMSDSGRLSRGKRYHKDDAVTDITIGRGAATAEVQGSRYDPYVVTIEAEPGDGVPARSEVWVSCTCPDDNGTGRDMCKHAVAAMLTLATEVSIEPELLERWRTGRRARERGNVYDIRSGEPVVDDTTDDKSDHDVEAAERAREVDQQAREADVISSLLVAPDGTSPPTFAPVAPIEHPMLANELLDEVLDDALTHLRIRWE